MKIDSETLNGVGMVAVRRDASALVAEAAKSGLGTVPLDPYSFRTIVGPENSCGARTHR